MSIEEDVDYALFNFPLPGVETAYIMLSRFDQVKGWVDNDEDVELFTASDIIPPTIRVIVGGYIGKNISKQMTIKLLEYKKEQAYTIFKKRGYNPDSIFGEECKTIEVLEEQVKKYDSLIEKLEKSQKIQES